MGRHLLVAALLLTVAGCAAGGGEDIHIGLAAPVGIAFGESYERAARMAVQEINDNRGINGRMLVLDIKDDEMERERAIRVATEFRDEGKVVAVIGHATSSAAVAAADIYNHPVNGLLAISPTATSPELSGKGEWTFRVCPTDLHQGSALAEWAYTSLGKRRAAVVYANDEYGRGVLQAFAPVFEELGGKVVAQDPFLASITTSESHFEPYLERAILNGMDALVIVGVGDEVLDILRAARRLGFQGPVMGADGLTDLVDAGAVAEGIFMTAAFLPDRPAEPAREFVRKYVDQFGEVPSDRAALTYDAVMLIARALAEVGPDRQALRGYIASVGTGMPAFEGVTGTISLDDNGDTVDKDLAVGVIRDGEIVTAQ